MVCNIRVAIFAADKKLRLKTFLHIDTDFKLWHRKEHTNQVKEKEEISTVSESVWLLQTAARFFPVAEQRDVRSYPYLLKEDIRDNDLSLNYIQGVNSFELTPFFCTQKSPYLSPNKSH
jgi:hypothetical protein